MKMKIEIPDTVITKIMLDECEAIAMDYPNGGEMYDAAMAMIYYYGTDKQTKKIKKRIKKYHKSSWTGL